MTSWKSLKEIIFYFGLKNGIILKLEEFHDRLYQQCIIYIQINVDGLPLFKSSPLQFWPVLVRIVNPIPSEPFIVTLWLGKSKPLNLEFLQEFVIEFNDISNGFLVNDKEVLLQIHSIVCLASPHLFQRVSEDLALALQVLLREKGGSSGVRSPRGCPASFSAPETGWCIGVTCNNPLDAELRMRFTSCSCDTVNNLIDDLKVN